jgi:hypothetical protein
MKALLRQWWRVSQRVATATGHRQMREREGRLFGNVRISAHRGRPFQSIVDGVSEERGRRFRLIVDDVSA